MNIVIGNRVSTVEDMERDYIEQIMEKCSTEFCITLEACIHNVRT